MVRKPTKWTFAEVEAMALSSNPTWWNGLTMKERREAARQVNEKAALEVKIRNLLTIKPVSERKARKR
jgi:hypothetical protein